MKDDFIKHIKYIRELVESDSIKDLSSILPWVAILETTAINDTGIFYKDFFFAVIEEKDVEWYKEVNMFPETVYEEDYDVPMAKKGYLICYDLVDSIGYPVIAINIPFMKLVHTNEELMKKIYTVLDKYIDIYALTLANQYDSTEWTIV